MNAESPAEEALFQAVLSLSGPARAALLAQAGEGDPALRARLEARIAVQEAALAATDSMAATVQDTRAIPAATVKIHFGGASGDEAVGQTLGRYKLLEKLGEGGCGVVYVAEQTEPVRRRVALKVIKLGDLTSPN
jgi:eukaryotic-like serine/threonine-protein kinase